MNMNEMFPSKFLKAEDFADGESRTLTIQNVLIEEIGAKGKQEKKPIVYWKEAQKPLVLNKTNAAIIAKMYGDETDNWLDQRVTLITLEVDSFGDVVRAIRVKPTMPVKKPAPVDVGFEGTGVQVSSKHNGKKALAEVQTDKWPKLVIKAMENGYIPNDSESSQNVLLQVIADAGIDSVNDLSINNAWKAVQVYFSKAIAA